jgi:hypothetical protein
VEAMKGEMKHAAYPMEQYHVKNKELEEELREYKQKV